MNRPAKALATSLVASSDTVPAYLKSVATDGVGRGNELVGGAMEPPRLKLMQQLNKEVDKNHANFIEGASVGTMINTVTKEIYGETVYVLSLMFKIVYQVKRDFNEGGGYKGKFESEAEAIAVKNQQPPHETWAVKETHEHLLVVKNPKTGALESTPVIMEFEMSKLPKSRAWNTLIGMQGGDRFSCLYKIQGSTSTNAKSGASFYNVDCSLEGYAHEADYLAAEDMYEMYKPVAAIQ